MCTVKNSFTTVSSSNFLPRRISEFCTQLLLNRVFYEPGFLENPLKWICFVGQSMTSYGKGIFVHKNSKGVISLHNIFDSLHWISRSWGNAWAFFCSIFQGESNLQLAKKKVGFVKCWKNVVGGENGQDKDIFEIHLGMERTITAKPLYQDYSV